MSISIDFHVDGNSEGFGISAHANQHKGNVYSTLSVKSMGGHEGQQVTFYLNAEQIIEFKKALSKMQREHAHLQNIVDAQKEEDEE